MIALALLAASFQDIAALDRGVAAFTARAIGQEGGPRAAIDPRLRLTQCPTLSMAWRTDAHDAVVVSCTGPQWRIFVPVVMPANTTVISGAAAPGAVARNAEKVIKRGDPLTIEAGSNGFSITREGVAMGDAAVGERLMVKVENARMPVQAVAVEAGRATLPGWSEQ
ncbi:flagella basal body P-ring formation protein FlgA [uncultured Sphingomonas sp.]|uniref:flagella basal body P-ring formation protein FlgA n=1 Tax=uncultured Sphingomonas sp. TaxID=158754 RepID=UPI00262ABADE|nr:flagella basal body P-ring formation protein FlgA [uncultured Sphingomonas sp.]